MPSKQKIFYLTLAATAALLAATTSAQAAGFYLQETSAEGVGTAFAGGPTSIDNASTAYSNPAGLTDLHGAQASIGAQLLVPYAHVSDRGSTFTPGAPPGTFPVGGTSGGNPYALTELPNLYMSVPVTDRLTAGFSLTTPFGLAEDYGGDFFGRFDSTKTKLTVVEGSPVLAYKLTNQVSVGGGLDVQYASARLENAVAVPGIGVGTGVLSGEDTSVGYNLGVKYAPVPATTLGLTYRSPVTHKLVGHIQGQGLGPLSFYDAGTATLNLPDIAAFGIAQKITPRTRVMGSVSWYNWSRFNAITPFDTTTGSTSSSSPVPLPIAATAENYRDTVSFALGGEYDLTHDWTVRAGYQYDPTPTRDGFRDTRVPDGNRNYFGTGATYHINQHSSIDMAAAYVHMSDEGIDVTRNVGAANVVGETASHVTILSLAYNFNF